MLHHIQKLRKHPEHVRERIALVVAAAVTLVVFVGWATTLDTRLAFLDFGGGNTASVAESHGGLRVVNAKEETNSPAAIFKEKAGETYDDFRKAIGY